MRIKGIIFLWVISNIIGYAIAFSQGVAHEENYLLLKDSNKLELKKKNIIKNSLKIEQENKYALTIDLDYNLNTKDGIIYFTEFFIKNRLLQKDSIIFKVEYRNINIANQNLQIQEIKKKTIENVDIKTPTNINTSSTTNEIFGKDFKRSGSIVRGLTIGSNQDLTLNSVMRIQFSGKITQDVEVAGVLSDEQTPIQPEGTTQTIKEIDNIFVSFKSNSFNGIVGKFKTKANNDNINLDKKIQGLMGNYAFNDKNKIKAVVGLSQGKVGFITIQGRDGIQGPYRLLNEFGEKNIVIIAGSEKVYINGLIQQRGLNNDYIIDYTNGELIFQPKKIITAQSKIEIDYEYMNENYARSYVELESKNLLIDSLVKINFNLIGELDDKKAPINTQLSPEDIEILKKIERTNGNVTKKSEVYVGRADSVFGNYIKIDTIINGMAKSIYKFEPTNVNALYEIAFSYVGEKNGDYKNMGFGYYEYVGEKLGNYLPIKYLPIPTEQINSILEFSVNPTKNITIANDLNYSYKNPNLFSENANPFQGFQIKTRGNFDYKDLNDGNKMELNLEFRKKTNEFSENGRLFDKSLTLLTDINFDELTLNKDLYEFIAKLVYEPIKGLLIYGNARTVNVNNSEMITSNQNYGVEYETTNKWRAKLDIKHTKLDSVNNTGQRNWLDYKIGFGKNFEDMLELNFDIVKDNRKIKNYEGNLDVGGWIRNDLNFSFSLKLKPINLRGGVVFSTIDSVKNNNGKITEVKNKAIIANIQNENNFNDFKQINSISFRKPIFQNTELNNSLTLLIKSDNKIALFQNIVKIDLNYEANSQMIGKIEKLFIKVPFALGKYKWNDLNNDKIQQEQEFFITNNGDGEYMKYENVSDNLIPAIDLKTDLRINTDFSKLSDLPIIKDMKSETIFRVSEKNKGNNLIDIYLLNLRNFQDSLNTILGNSHFQQNLYFFENNENVNLKIKYLNRASLINYLTYSEIQKNQELGGGLFLSLTKDLKNEFNVAIDKGLLYINSENQNNSIGKSYNIRSMKYENELSYLAIKNLDIIWKIRYNDVQDINDNKKNVFLLTNILKAYYALGINGRLRFEIERSKVSTDLGDAEIIPYQMSEGYAKGVTWIGNTSLDYRIGSNLQLNVSYIGRVLPPTNKLIHTGQTEIKAFF